MLNITSNFGLSDDDANYDENEPVEEEINEMDVFGFSTVGDAEKETEETEEEEETEDEEEDDEDEDEEDEDEKKDDDTEGFGLEKDV